MKKLALFDPYLLKFTDGMVKWWSENGYEVKYDRYYNPQLAEWADILWFDTADNNIASATNPSQAILSDEANYQPWDLHDMDLSNKHVIVRPIDIEVWQGHQSAAKWDVVDDIVFIAPHIRNVFGDVETKAEFHTVPCAVDFDKFTFKERSPGKNIAIISEKWNSKGTHLILQVLLKLKQIDDSYKINWLGQRSDQNWEYAYFDEFVEHHNLNIEFTNILQDGATVDEFLEGNNYLLHGSVKEGFSYATAEAMAKGIKPVVHRFFGADDIWPGMTWDTVDQAIEMLTNDKYDSHAYRGYLISQGYDLPSMMARIDKIIKKEE